jgi:serine/threonine protein kinase
MFLKLKLSFSAYGSVYKAMHIGTGIILAIKAVKIGKDKKMIDDIKSEIDMLKKCKHSCIVGLYGCCFTDTELWVSKFLSLCS